MPISVSTETAADDPTPTQKIYSVIHDLQAMHDQAMQDMKTGYARGDEDLIADAFIRITRLEPQMRAAGIEARKYFLSKVITPQGSTHHA